MFNSNGVVGLKFVTAPSENAFINYSLHESTEITEQLYSEVTVDRFVGDGSTVELSLSEAPGNRLPLSHNIVVKIDNKILYPGYTQHWYIESGREYPLDRSQFPVSSLSPDEVDVYVAGKKLVLLNDYRWDFTNTQVVLFDGVGLIGDDLEVFVKKDREYIFSENTRISLANVNGTYIEGETVTIGTDDSNTYTTIVKSYNPANNILVLKGILEGLDLQIDTDNTIPVTGQTSGALSNDILSVDQVEGGDTLILTDTPAVDSLIDIYKFTKHDIQYLQLRTVVNATRSNLIVDSEEYYEFHRLNKGLVKLRQPAIGVEYLWVILNGELLTSSIDYKLVKLDNYIQITRNINVNDTIQVIHFAGTWKLYQRANRKAWEAAIPIYNAVILMKIINRPKWWVILLFIPVINQLMFPMLWIETARSFGFNKRKDTALVLLTLGFYLFFINYATNSTYKLNRSLKPRTALGEWVSSIAFAIIAATLVHTYVMQPYTIPTSSLEKTLLVGDYLFVSKFHYGARVPTTTIATPMLHDSIPTAIISEKNTKSYLNKPLLPYLRIPGFQKIKRNDIVVFNWPVDTLVHWMDPSKGTDFKPLDKKTNYVKRCVGIAGDTLEVRDGYVYINGKQNILPDRAKLQFYNRVYSEKGFSTQKLLRYTDKEFERKSELRDSILNKSRIKQEAEKSLTQ